MTTTENPVQTFTMLGFTPAIGATVVFVPGPFDSREDRGIGTVEGTDLWGNASVRWPATPASWPTPVTNTPLSMLAPAATPAATPAIVIDKSLWIDGDQYLSDGYGLRTRTSANGRIEWRDAAGACNWVGDPDLNAQGAVGMPDLDGSPNDLSAVIVGGKPWAEWAQVVDASAVAEILAAVDLVKSADVTMDASVVADLQAEIARLTREIEGKDERLTYVNGRNTRLTSDLETWQNDARIVGEALRDEAIRRGWCSEYGQFVNNVNGSVRFFELLPCERDWSVTYTVTYTVTAASEEDAESMVSSELHTFRRQSDYSVEVSHDSTDEA